VVYSYLSPITFSLSDNVYGGAGVSEGPMDVLDDDFDEEMIRAVEDVHGPILDDLYIIEQYDNFPEEKVKHVLESVYTAGVTELQKTINKKVQE
jgi:hypothetical protein